MIRRFVGLSFFVIFISQLEAMENVIRQSDVVWVRVDDQVISVEKWKIHQMEVLQNMLTKQRKKNSTSNPLNASRLLTIEELLLLSDALDAASKGMFEDFYVHYLLPEYQKSLTEKINGDSVLHMLINACQKTKAIGLLALCGTYYFPSELQSLLSERMIQPVVDYLQAHLSYKTIVSGVDASTVSLVAFNCDGTKIIYGKKGQQDDLVVWNVATEQSYQLSGSLDDIASVSLDRDGTKMAFGFSTYQDNVVVFDSQVGERHDMGTHPKGVIAVAWSLDGKKIVSGGKNNPNNNVIVWDFLTGKQSFIAGNPGGVKSVALSTDGKWVVSGGFGNQNNLIVWDVITGKEIANLVGHSTDVKSVAFNLQNNNIVSLSNDHLIVWDAVTGKQLHAISGDFKNIFSVAFDQSGSNIVYCGFSEDNKLRVWEYPVDTIDSIKHHATLAQSRLLYQMYIAKMSRKKMTLKSGSPEYAVYQTLPNLVKDLVSNIFNVKIKEGIKDVAKDAPEDEWYIL